MDSLTAEIRRRCLYYLSGVCGRKSLLPKSLPDPLHYGPTEEVQYYGEIATVAKGKYKGRVVAAKIWSGLEGDLDQTRRVGAAQLVVFQRADYVRQRFYEGVVVWKALRHPNILPLIGIATTQNQFTTVSEWMNNGNINEFTKAHPDANRLELVCFPLFSHLFSELVLKQLL